MELRFRNSFFRDLDNISNRELRNALATLLERIEKSENITTIPRVKKLRRTRAFEYKIELSVQTKIYWILVDVHGNRVEFLRIKSEAWCKTNL